MLATCEVGNEYLSAVLGVFFLFGQTPGAIGPGTRGQVKNGENEMDRNRAVRDKAGSIDDAAQECRTRPPSPVTIERPGKLASGGGRDEAEGRDDGARTIMLQVIPPFPLRLTGKAQQLFSM